MYNCFFGMPFRRNFSYNNSHNSPHKTLHAQNYTDKQCTKKISKEKNNDSNTNRNLLKSSSLGGIVIPPGSLSGSTYNLISINLDTSTYKNFCINFNFSCTITNTIAMGDIHLRFQLCRHEKYINSPIPVSSNYSYSRGLTTKAYSETDSFSFTAYDYEAMKCKRCIYSLFIEIVLFNKVDSIIITNPTLIASIIEKAN